MSLSSCSHRIQLLVTFTAALLAPIQLAQAQNRIEMPGEDRSLTLDVQELFSVGSITGDEWETFSRVGEKGPVDLITQEGVYLGTLSPGEGRIPDAFGPGGLAAFVEQG